MTIQEALNIAIARHQAGQLHQAEKIYRQILAQQPDHPDALHFLGVIAHQAGRNDIAVDLIGRAIAGKPTPEAHNNLGNARKGNGQLDEAIAAFRRAIALRPNYPEAYSNLGNALKGRGQLDEAIAAHRQAIALRPNSAEAHGNLGNALADKGQLDEAIDAYRQFIALKPNSADALSNLGNALTEKGQLDEAIAAYRQAIALRPGYAEAHGNLGNALAARGELDEAIAAYRQAIALKPDYTAAHSSLVYALHFHPAYDARAIAGEHRDWNRRHAEPLRAHIKVHANDRDPERRLRIGYVSPDFRDHVVGMNLLPLFLEHDRQQFEITCYSQVLRPDANTGRFQQCADGWRNIVGLPDDAVAKQIIDDRIDILVDLTLHMAHNRLLIFARKPAPVQVTYLAYAGSSGLSTMDYRLSDPYLDPFDHAQGRPPGGDESVYSEQTVRLPQTYWCYRPMVELPVNPPPAMGNGFITFGCLNNFCKVNEPLLNLWGRILAAVPNSRLILHSHQGSHRQRVLDFLEVRGIEPGRVSFAGMTPTREYLELYHSIDIALDTTPYGGGTTTCDALWMGAAVVSLAGKTAVGRGGLTILSNIGLPELVANTPEEYVRLAVALANDPPRLQELRSSLRQRMKASPLMDAPKFARGVESAYRRMWRTWCEAK